jgi:hypothetical protein
LSSTTNDRPPSELALRTLVLISADARTRLSIDAQAYERFVAAEVLELERAYHSGSAPELVALAACARVSALDGISPRPSAAHARLRALTGQMQVAAGGNAEFMAEAETHLVAGIEELCAVDDWTREHLKLLAELVLNHAVTLKARGSVQEAAQLLRSTMTDPALRPYWANGDRLPLMRQDVIMAGGVGPHRWLAEQHDAMRAAGALEHYRTVKRLLEFAMNQGNIRAARRLLPAAIRAFSPLRDSAPPLARVSLVKNVGQLQALDGRPQRGLVLLRLAGRAAEEQGLRGQMRQIDQMMEMVQAGERPLLRTYVAA